MVDNRDTRDTAHRTKIQALYVQRTIVPTRRGFGCKSLLGCSESGQLRLRTGNWAFVGAEYGSARVCGHRARILFVAMDRGGYGGADTEAFQDTQAAFRRSIESPRNPHMGGVRLILKELVDEQDANRLSVLCALTNAVKCVQHTGQMSTAPTRAMIGNCSEHLLAEIRALDPDLVITQGGHPRKTVVSLLENLHLVREFGASGRGSARVLTNSRLVVMTTPHPARQAGLKWKQGLLPPFFMNAIAVARMELVVKLRLRNR